MRANTQLPIYLHTCSAALARFAGRGDDGVSVPGVLLGGDSGMKYSGGGGGGSGLSADDPWAVEVVETVVDGNHDGGGVELEEGESDGEIEIVEHDPTCECRSCEWEKLLVPSSCSEVQTGRIY